MEKVCGKQKDMTHYRRLVELLKNEIQKRLQLM